MAVPPEDSTAFVTALTALLDAPEQLVAMGSRGRSYVENAVSPRGVAQAYEAVFERVRQT